MARTIDQQIAETQAKLARLRTRARASDTRRKIVVGSVVISNALKEPDKARALAALLRRTVTREVDQKELVGLLAELDARAARGTPPGSSSGSPPGMSPRPSSEPSR